MLRKIIFVSWIGSAIALLLYSFTQVDLSLTFSQIAIYQTVERVFQYVGWFNRPLSAVLFIIIFSVMFLLYGLTLDLVRKKAIEKKNLWKIIICLTVILFFAYNAFSYDLFNYIFDAKIVAHYQANPYFQKALDYPHDPMLSFMHWTHRTYPYGPVWLAITVPAYFVGFGYFLLTFYLFKLITALSFIGSIFLIERIAKKMSLDSPFVVAAFALNPLVLAESLVSAHNDIVMVFFGLLSLFMFLEKKYIKSLVGLIISIAVKYATVLMIPALFARGIFKVGKEKFFYILTVSMLVAVVLATYRTTFQPWYLIFVLPFAAFVQNKYFVMIPVFIISIAAILQYLPFIYLGNWNPPVPMILNYIMYASIVTSVALILGVKLFRKE